MRNITITMEEEVARWVRVRAAEENVSVARWVGRILAEHMRDDEEYERAMDEFFSIRPRLLKRSGRYPTRADLHDRSGRDDLR